MNLDGALERLAESGDSFKDGFYISDSFSLGSDSQAAVRKTGMIQLEKRSLLTLCKLEKIERLLQEEKKR